MADTAWYFTVCVFTVAKVKQTPVDIVDLIPARHAIEKN